MATQPSLIEARIPARESSAAGGDRQAGPLGQVIGIIARPADVFRRMRDGGRSHWWLVFALNIAGLALTAAASASSLARAAANFASRAAGSSAVTTGTAAAARTTQAASDGASSLSGSIGMALAGGLALMLADLLLRTLVVSGMSLVLGGKAGLRQSFRMSLWTSIPFALRCVAQSAAMFATGGQSVSGMAGVMTTAESQALPLVSTLLGAIDFYMLWSAVLLAIGVSITASVSRGKGIATTLVYLGLALGGILALRAISSALGSTLGSGSSLSLPGGSGGLSGGMPSGGPGGAPPGQ